MRISNHPPKPATGTYRSLYLGVALAMGSLFAGCGANLSAAPAIHRAGPEGGRNLSTLTPSEMAFGNLTSDRHVSSEVDLTPYLNPQLPEPAVVASAEPAKPAAPKVRSAVAAPSEVVAEAPATEEVAASPEPIVLASLSDTQPAPMSNDAERYAEREAQSQSQQEYMGGDVLVISASTIVIVLLITLLVLLLT